MFSEQSVSKVVKQYYFTLIQTIDSVISGASLCVKPKPVLSDSLRLYDSISVFTEKETILQFDLLHHGSHINNRDISLAHVKWYFIFY